MGWQRIEVPMFVFNAIAKTVLRIEAQQTVILTVCTLNAIALFCFFIAQWGLGRKVNEIHRYLKEEADESERVDANDPWDNPFRH